MQLHREAIDLIKRSEGCRLTAYKCPAGIWTIGYGDTGPHVVEGLVWTQDQADSHLAARLDEFAHDVDISLTRKATSNQFGAMVSLAYNIGISAFRRSSVLRQHNSGKITAAANAFLMWSKGGGQVLPGLVTRRAAERALYLGVA